ncbi:hypothetical protein PUNSTDRAFT_131661 [Punctularia strigosozonata HHB-11173 SS5]|uniref:uncharacterized protein n=1 Tax=Punctularia strigosozonata (strain HHB-11173) TaxID=741275 RepID=UPI0004417300|nr:uncharacterized protein PUNSTDRAFT_131661 [Punctularia strigosozonata HHB-11173 SS5]EIN11496.1 hypothetical protein PUNSTDRAFT_131661 [Punctularia strigosozonata HHB-11173 SS5]
MTQNTSSSGRAYTAVLQFSNNGVGHSLFSTPIDQGDAGNGWQSIEAVLIRLNNTYATSPRFPVYGPESNGTMSLIDGSGPGGYTELIPERVAETRALADSLNLLPYLTGSGRLFAASFRDKTYTSARVDWMISFTNIDGTSRLANAAARASVQRVTRNTIALSNLARATAAALGAYDRSRALSEQERRVKDDKLNFAVTLLCRASGVFAYVSEAVLPQWEEGIAGKPGISRPPDLNREVTIGLSKCALFPASGLLPAKRLAHSRRMALMDAQTLAIHKLLTKATVESTFSLGPPLPKLHPSPVLVAKLHLECAETYASALELAKTPGASHKPKHPFGLGK